MGMGPLLLDAEQEKWLPTHMLALAAGFDAESLPSAVKAADREARRQGREVQSSGTEPGAHTSATRAPPTPAASSNLGLLIHPSTGRLLSLRRSRLLTCLLDLLLFLFQCHPTAVRSEMMRLKSQVLLARVVATDIPLLMLPSLKLLKELIPQLGFWKRRNMELVTLIHRFIPPGHGDEWLLTPGLADAVNAIRAANANALTGGGGAGGAGGGAKGGLIGGMSKSGFIGGGAGPAALSAALAAPPAAIPITPSALPADASALPADASAPAAGGFSSYFAASASTPSTDAASGNGFVSTLTVPSPLSSLPFAASGAGAAVTLSLQSSSGPGEQAAGGIGSGNAFPSALSFSSQLVPAPPGGTPTAVPSALLFPAAAVEGAGGALAAGNASVGSGLGRMMSTLQPAVGSGGGAGSGGAAVMSAATLALLQASGVTGFAGGLTDAPRRAKASSRKRFVSSEELFAQEQGDGDGDAASEDGGSEEGSALGLDMGSSAGMGGVSRLRGLPGLDRQGSGSGSGGEALDQELLMLVGPSDASSNALADPFLSSASSDAGLGAGGAPPTRAVESRLGSRDTSNAADSFGWAPSSTSSANGSSSTSGTGSAGTSGSGCGSSAGLSRGSSAQLEVGSGLAAFLSRSGSTSSSLSSSLNLLGREAPPAPPSFANNGSEGFTRNRLTRTTGGGGSGLMRTTAVTAAKTLSLYFSVGGDKGADGEEKGADGGSSAEEASSASAAHEVQEGKKQDAREEGGEKAAEE